MPIRSVLVGNHARALECAAERRAECAPAKAERKPVAKKKAGKKKRA
jgi:hypothetical protein